MKICILTIAVGIAVSSVGPALGSADKNTAELESYIAQVCEFGMSEKAYELIQWVAKLASGKMEIDYRKDGVSGKYIATYSSVSISNCTATGTNRRVLDDPLSPELKRLMVLLRPLSDADSSGFVTTAEAKEFYSLVEFGQKVKAAIMFEGPVTGSVASALDLTTNELLARVGKYNNLVREAESAGVYGFKPVLVN